MRIYKWITISAAIVITALEAMVFNHETVAASNTASPSAAAVPASPAASSLQWLTGAAAASPSRGETHEPEPANP